MSKINIKEREVPVVDDEEEEEESSEESEEEEAPRQEEEEEVKKGKFALLLKWAGSMRTSAVRKPAFRSSSFML